MFLKAQFFVIIIFCKTSVPVTTNCDESAHSRFSEGNIGEIGYFPWLGVLRVHLHDGDITKIALTGLIYIKKKFTIANADDITRIPRHVLLTDSRAMFIPEDQKPWYCMVKEYMSHPEYEFATTNTIALVELKPNEDYFFPITPICIPKYAFNASNELYTIGYTDENKLLEKMIYKLQYVDPGLCDEFYNRAGLLGDKTAPTSYQCGFAVNNKENCVWENGMVLTSNSSSKWHLIGLSIKGPGCAAPARFIDLTSYIPWLESAMSLEDVYYPDYGRRAFSEDTNLSDDTKKKNGVEDVPVHALFRSNSPSSGIPMISEPYQFNMADYFSFNVERIDKDAIIVSRFDTKYEKEDGGCSSYNMLVYREMTKVVAPGSQGTASYKLTLYDMIVKDYTCIEISIECHNRTDAYLYYKTSIDMQEASAVGLYGQTPEKIIKEHPIPKLKKAPLNVTLPPVWRPSPFKRPEVLTDELTNLPIPNINLWVQFIFKDNALIKFTIHGKAFPVPKFRATPNPVTDTTTKKKKKKKLRVNYRKMEKAPQVVSRVVEKNSASQSFGKIFVEIVFYVYLLNEIYS